MVLTFFGQSKVYRVDTVCESDSFVLTRANVEDGGWTCSRTCAVWVYFTHLFYLYVPVVNVRPVLKDFIHF